jgi:hypothetical protein
MTEEGQGRARCFPGRNAVARPARPRRDDPIAGIDGTPR